MFKKTFIVLFFIFKLDASQSSSLISNDNDRWEPWHPFFNKDVSKLDIDNEIIFDEQEKEKKAIEMTMELIRGRKEVYFFSVQKYSFIQNLNNSGSLVRNILVNSRTVVAAQFLEKLNSSVFDVAIFNSKSSHLLDPYDQLGISFAAFLKKLEMSEIDNGINLSLKLKDRAVAIQTNSGTYYCARGPLDTMISVWPEEQFKKACEYR